MSPPADQRAECFVHARACSTPNVAPLVRGADGAARRPYLEGHALRMMDERARPQSKILWQWRRELHKLTAEMSAKSRGWITTMNKGLLLCVLFAAILAQPGCGPKNANETSEDQSDRRKRAAELYDRGKYFEAESEYRTLLQIDERVLGPEHPD